VKRVSQEEEKMEEVAENVIRKKIKIPYISDAYEARYYCGKCRAQLLWSTEFPEVSTVHEISNCKHFEWEETRSYPRLPDPENWWYQLEKPLLDQIKNRLVFVYPTSFRYYSLLKKMSKKS